MTYLNAQQLAFILDIKKEDARARMCNAWCKAKGIPNDSDNEGPKVAGATWEKKKLIDSYPQAMPVEMLSEQLNLPTLQVMIDDIRNNYLKRPATRKYILADFPEKQIQLAEKAGKQAPYKIAVPPALKSFLNQESLRTIENEWRSRFNEKYAPNPTVFA